MSANFVLSDIKVMDVDRDMLVSVGVAVKQCESMIISRSAVYCDVETVIT